MPRQIFGADGALIETREDRTVEEARAQRLQKTSAWRDKAIKEFFSFSGVPITLNDQTEARINGAAAGLQRKPSGATVQWKAGDNWITLDLAGLEALGDAAFDHVQACFDRAKVLTDAINAAPTNPEVDAIAVNTGWPGQP